MQTKESFWKAGHWPTLLSAFLYFDVSFMIWVLLGAVGNYLAAELHLNPAQKGLLTALPLLGGSILRLVFGHLTDTIGAKWTACLGMLVTLIPLFAGWQWADSLPKLYAVGLLMGVAGASFAAALPLASRWYPAQYQGLAMGIAGAGNSGTLFAAFFGPRLAERLGWHQVFGLAMLPLLAVLVIFLIAVKEPPRPDRTARGSDFWPVLRERDTRSFALFYGVTFGGFVGLASFLPIWLRDQYAVSKVHAGDLTTLCVLAGSFLRPVGGWLADRLGGIRMLMGLYSAVVVLVLLLALLPPLSFAMALLLATMGCLGMGNGSVFQLVPHRFPDRVGVATGILGAAGGLGGFFLPTIFGTLKQATGSYSAGLLVFATAAVAALICLTLAQRTWVGVWIAKHGRVATGLDRKSAEDALSGRTPEDLQTVGV